MQNSNQNVFDDSFASVIEDIFDVATLDRKEVYAAFFRKYNAFVLHELSKRNTLTQNFEDLCARIWVDFSGSTTKDVGLIEKFFGQAAISIPDRPETFTGSEVLTRLSVTQKEWVSMWERCDNTYPKLPYPILGTHREITSIYSAQEVEDWFDDFDRYRDEVKGLRVGAWSYVLPAPKATRKHFVNYLKRSIVNRWANFCRYEKRRHQERVWDTFADQRSPLEEPAPWEDRQEVPSCQEDEVELSLLVQKLQRTPAAPFIKQILLFIYDDGYSLRAAIQKVDGMTADQKRFAIGQVYKMYTPKSPVDAIVAA